MTQSLIESKLRRIFKNKTQRSNWLKTYNLLLDGDCPEDLMVTEEGLKKVVSLLCEMCPTDETEN